MNKLKMLQLEETRILAVEVFILETVWIHRLWNTRSLIEVAARQDMVQAVSFLWHQGYFSILLAKCVVVEQQCSLEHLLAKVSHVVGHLNHGGVDGSHKCFADGRRQVLSND